MRNKTFFSPPTVKTVNKKNKLDGKAIIFHYYFPERLCTPDLCCFWNYSVIQSSFYGFIVSRVDNDDNRRLIDWNFLLFDGDITYILVCNTIISILLSEF